MERYIVFSTVAGQVRVWPSWKPAPLGRWLQKPIDTAEFEIALKWCEQNGVHVILNLDPYADCGELICP